MNPTTAPPRDEELVACAGRAAMYALLAHGLAAPEPHRWDLVTRSLVPAIRSLELPDAIARSTTRLAETAPEDCSELAAAHLALFPPVAHQDAPGYETAYRGDDLFRQMDLLADVAGFYRAHGVEVGGNERERPDHIVVELEFCSLVSRKEFYALTELGPDQVEVCRATLTTFLADHLACWAPAFGRRAAAVATHPWFRLMGGLVAQWVEADAAALGVDPVEMAYEPLPQDPPDDGICGPCPVGVAP